MKRTPTYSEFSISDCLKRASVTLSLPPTRPHIQRTRGEGELVARFALPLELCPTTNRTRHRQAWMLGKLKKDCFTQMWAQNGGRVRVYPLPGRPMVRAIRFSATEPDAYSDWAKIPIDRLCVRNKGLGFLRDDRPKDLNLFQWWEPAPRGEGFAYIEVWTGSES